MNSQAPAIPILSRIKCHITVTMWITDSVVETTGVVISCGEYDSQLRGRKYCVILDNPKVLEGTDEETDDGMINLTDLDARQDKPIEILGVLTPEEAYTHSNKYVRLAIQAIKVNMDPLDYISHLREEGALYD